MARIDKQLQGHLEGMAHALKLVQTEGVEGLEQELKMRGLTRVPITVSKGTIDKVMKDIKEMNLDCTIILFLSILHDKYGWGQKRCQDLLDQVVDLCDSMGRGYCEWKDYIAMMEQEVGIKLGIRHTEY